MKGAGISIFPERARAIYNKVRSHLKTQGYTGVVSPRTLRVEVYTENGKGEYTLSLKDNSPRLSGANTEVRLKEQDAFVFCGVRLSLAKESAVLGIERLHLYPNIITFPNEAGGMQNAHLDGLYNGGLYLKVGDQVYLEDFNVQDSYIVRTSQEAAALATRSERLAGDGFVPLTPQFTLRGFETNDLTYKLRNANSNQKVQYSDTATNGKIKMVFEFPGFVVTGAGANKNIDLNFDN